MSQVVSVRRFAANPLFTPETTPPSRDRVKVEGVLNPGAFRYQGKVGLIIRVAERPLCEADEVATFVMDADGVKPMVVKRSDPDFSQCDPRSFAYRGVDYLTTMSHLLIVWSKDNGETFSFEDSLRLYPKIIAEGYGIEDCRVSELDGIYHLTYTAVGTWGITIGHMSTSDWVNFSEREVMFTPCDKDCAFFPRKVNGKYYALHRPHSGGKHGNHIWMAESPDLKHWGNHQIVAMTRPGEWDSERIGGGASPIETEAGFLEIYHGADDSGRYALGAILFDKNNPFHILARSATPIMVPEADYEVHGFYSQCIFTNGHIVDGDRVRIYYGASDQVVAAADLSISEILASLK